MTAPSGWRTTCLGDVADVVGGGTPSASDSTLWGRDVPWLTPKDLSRRPARYTDGGLRSLSKEGLRRSSARILPPGAVLVSSRAPIGLVTIARRALATSQGFRSLILSGENVPEFFYYLIGASTGLLEARANGSTFKEISGSSLKLVEVSLPTISEQRGIAAALGSLDDKIESNRRQAVLIGALFTAEFLALISGCQTRRTLDGIATFTKGVSYRSAELSLTGDTSLVTLKSVGRHGGYQSSGLKPYIGHPKPEQVVQPSELVVAQTDLTQAADLIGRVVRVPAGAGGDRLVASLDLVIVRPREPMPVEFLYGVLLEDRFREHCRSRSSGTTVLHLSRDALPQYQAPIVAFEEQQRFAALSRPFLDKQDALGRESIRLAALRDALLPELLSGRIRVPEASEAVESALA